MLIKRILAAILAVFSAAIIYASDKKEDAPEYSASVKIQRLYMINVIKANIEKDPESPFSVYAKNEIGSDGVSVSSLYYELVPPGAPVPPERTRADTKGADKIVCRSGAKSEAKSYDGTVLLYGENYFVSCGKEGASLVLRSPDGMIKGAPKDASSCLPDDDKLIREISSDGRFERLLVKAGALGGAEAFCVVDPTLSSPLLYDFSASGRSEKS